jgi:hypothetical protein
MPWFLGCLSLVFVAFGGCVVVSSLLAFPVGSDTGFLTTALVLGVLVLGFGAWLFYRAVTMRRTRSIVHN